MLITTDARHISRVLADQRSTIDLAVTSPPYYELAQYGDNPAEIGHELTPARYVDQLMVVLNELRWLKIPIVAVNIGDSYAGSGGPGGDYLSGSKKTRLRYRGTAALERAARKNGIENEWPAPQSLCLTPELFRLSAVMGRNPITGVVCSRWVARSVIIWAKKALPRAPFRTKALPTYETIVILTDPTRKTGWKALKNLEKWEGQGNLWEIPPARGKEAHGRAPWPSELPRRIIEATGAKRVLDPFHGGGNTERACQTFEGVEYIGCDLYPERS